MTAASVLLSPLVVITQPEAAGGRAVFIGICSTRTRQLRLTPPVVPTHVVRARVGAIVGQRRAATRVGGQSPP